MNKADFKNLFLRSLVLASEQAELTFSRTIPRSFLIELWLDGCNYLNEDEALERLYLGQDRFFRLIDVFVKYLLPGKTIVFVRPSAHPPDHYDRTWNPSELGPFKPLVALKLDEAIIAPAKTERNK